MKWRIQFILLVGMMFCFIFGGIHLAERGIQRVEGIQDGPAQSFQIARLKDGKLQMTVLGKEYALQDEALVPVFKSDPSSSEVASNQEAPSHFSGNEIGSWITSFSQKLLSWIFN